MANNKVDMYIDIAIILWEIRCLILPSRNQLMFLFWTSFFFFISMCVVDPSTDGKLNDSSGGEVTTTFSLPILVNCSSKEYHLESFNDFLTLVPDYVGTIFVSRRTNFRTKLLVGKPTKGKWCLDYKSATFFFKLMLLTIELQLAPTVNSETLPITYSVCCYD